MLPVSDKLKSIFNSEYTPVLILEVEGLPSVSSGPVKKVLNFDDPYFQFDAGFSFDSLIDDHAILQLIKISDSSKSLSQRIDQENTSTSAQTFSVNIVDKWNLVTEWITPGLRIDDILGKKAKIYFSVVGGLHPQDSVLLMSGFIEGESSNPNTVTLSVASTEKLKQSDIFPKATTNIQDYPAFSTTLAADSAAGQTSFSVVDASGFPQAAIGGRFTIRLNGTDVLSYSLKTGNTLVYKQVGEVTATHGFYPAGTPVELYRQILATDNKIRLSNIENIIAPNSDATLTSFVKVDDEIIQYTAIAAGTLKGCVRGQFGTIAAVHDFGASVEPIYRLQGGLKDLSLKLMLSGNDNPYYYEGACDLVTSNGVTVTNAIFVKNLRLLESGIRVGDKVRIIAGKSGVSDPDSVLYDNATILSISQNDNAVYFVVNQTINSGANFGVKLKSQYNTLPVKAGLGLNPDQVDIDQHELIDSRFFGQLLAYDFMIKDKVTVSDLINQQIYRASGCFPIPRKGKASVGITSAPVVADDTVTLNASNISNASQIKRSRTVSKYFYNAVVFSYDKDVVTDKFKYGSVFLSNGSITRIKVPTKAYEMEAEGIRFSSSVKGQIETISKRILERFQYGTECFENIKLPASTGMLIEVGDIVVFDGANLNVSDIAKQAGNRNFKARFMEVVDKQDSPWSNESTLKLLDTSYAINGRYGTIAPASMVEAGSTSDTISLKKSFETKLGTNEEGFKWSKWVGETVAIRSQDWTQYGEKRIQYIDSPSAGITRIFLDSALSFTPAENYVMAPPKYGTGTDPVLNAKWKRNHVYLNPSVLITGTSSSLSSFPVSSADAALFSVGSIVKIHNSDYSSSSDDMEVLSIVGTTVTMKKPISFAVTAGMRVDLIGFKDGGLPYRWA